LINIQKAIIAIAQIGFSLEGSDQHIRYMGKAKEKGADIICFPEDFISINDDYKDYILEFFSPLCKKYEINAIIPIVTKDNEGLRKSALVIDRNGHLIGIYNKQNLYDCEINDFVPGEAPGIFDLDFGRIGIIICFDIFSPAVIAQYVNQGVKIIFCPSNMVVSDIRYKNQQINAINSIYTSIVFQAKCFFVTAMLNEKSLIAQSKIISPEGVLSKTRNNQNRLLVQEIDIQSLVLLDSLL